MITSPMQYQTVFAIASTALRQRQSRTLSQYLSQILGQYLSLGRGTLRLTIVLALMLAGSARCMLWIYPTSLHWLKIITRR